MQRYAFEPIIAYSMSRSISHLAHAFHTLEIHCVDGIEPNLDVLKRTHGSLHRLGHRPESTHRIPTRHRGYPNSLKDWATGLHIVLERGLLTKAQLDEILQPASLTATRALYLTLHCRYDCSRR
ncbi:MAG: hypothetical protein WAO93_02340 [Orrella sp.]|uniref:hypothetical protein n=1 Tax=Orrella sp. TaxID=1921583 RepID=UPI003BE8930E